VSNKKVKPEEEQSENFIVIDASPPKKTDNEKVLSLEDIAQRAMESAMREYNFDNKVYSVVLDSKGSAQDPTTEYLTQLADNPQNNLDKILQINRQISRAINIDDVIGKTVEAVRVNINTDYRLSYKKEEGRNKSKKLKDIRGFIDDFNEEIKIKRIIRERVPEAYKNGTVIFYLRNDEGKSWSVDVYPLGVAKVAPYSIGGEPIVLIDINELKSRLQKLGFKTRAGKNMFFPTIGDEIKANYPPEVYQAYVNKEPYAELDIRYSYVVRIGNDGGLYGVSPIFRALPASLILQSFYKSDEVTSRASAKKLLVQIMRENMLGDNGDKRPTTEMAFAHKELLKAYRQSGSVVYSAPAWIESVSYCEPKIGLTDVNIYRYHLNRVMASLGITFLSPESANQSVSTATISLEQLMKAINSIMEQFEDMFKKWYAQVLIDSGYDPTYAPDIKILDSEALEFKLKKELATFVYSQLNLSMRTALEILGYNLEEEVQRREEENQRGFDKIFTPRASQFTSSGNEKNGRPPAEEETDKTQYDDEYNKTRA
jgi:hypothetical protein